MRRNNSIYVVEMKRTKFPQPTKQNELLSLDDYLVLARKCISVYAPRIRSGLGVEMLQNEDAIANIANALMMADYKFDGRGSIGGYRKQSVIYAIRSYVEHVTHNNAVKKTSCFTDLGTKFGKDDATKEFDVADNSNPASISIDRERKENTVRIVKELLDSDILSDVQKKYIKMRFMDNMSVMEIATACDVSRQGVNDVILRGLDKMKQAIESDSKARDLINA